MQQGEGESNQAADRKGAQGNRFFQIYDASKGPAFFYLYRYHLQTGFFLSKVKVISILFKQCKFNITTPRVGNPPISSLIYDYFSTNAPVHRKLGKRQLWLFA